MFPDDLTTEVLTASLRGHNARNTAIANNIANAAIASAVLSWNCRKATSPENWFAKPNRSH